MFLVPRQSAGQAAFPATLEAPQQIVLPTGRPSGFPVNDRVPVAWYAPQRTEERAPAVILLHPLGEWRNTLMHRFARFLQARGFGAAVVTLPYHMKRWPKGHPPLDQFVAANVDRAADAFAQSEADARVVADWLVRRSDVDPARVGVIGVSLGAIVLHAAMGQDSRLSAGVAILGGGDLPYLYQRSLLFRILHPSTTRKLSEVERARLAEADPLTYADENRPRRVLMIQAARDVLIPPSASTQLWEALGRPPIRWLDTNHYGPMLGERTIMAAAAAFLQEAWSGRAGNPRLPPIYAPTIKIGALFGLDSTTEPALQWQALSFVGRPDHMSLLHLDFGWSGRGFFAGLAATVNPYLDVGVGRRLGGRVSRPYLSLHIVL